jgi:hypothetical protein
MCEEYGRKAYVVASTMKMEAKYFSEVLVSTHKTRLRQKSIDHHMSNHRSENLNVFVVLDNYKPLIYSLTKFYIGSLLTRLGNVRIAQHGRAFE